MDNGRRTMGGSRWRWFGWWIWAVWALAACNFGSQADHNAQATIEALATENALLATTVATLQPATSPTASHASIASSPLAPTSVPTATAGLSTTLVTSVQSDLQATAAGAHGTLPAVVAQASLAGDEQTLVDLLVDPATNRLYVTDTGERLYVLDATTYAPLATLAAWGMLTLDETNQRLFAAPTDLSSATEAAITVIDTQVLTVATTISNATHLSLDIAHNRLFVGNRLSLSNEESAPGVRVLAADTLAVLAEGPQAGIPVYNPQRDELLVVAYTVFSADPATAQMREDLLPEISEQPLRWCNGCLIAANAYVFAEANLALLDVVQSATGSGAGLAQPPRALDATTLAPLDDPMTAPPLQPTCGGRPLLQPTVDGRLFRWLTFNRYVVYNNLLVYDQAGSLLTWRDGLPPLYVHGGSGRGYGGGWVIDLRTLNPLGRIPPLCVLGEDERQGYVYAAQGNRLLVLDPSGDVAPTAAPGEDAALGASGPLPAQPVDQILFSPNYGNDETIFAVSGGHELYRSTNSGQTWAALHEGLDDADDAPANAVRTLAVSPNYSADRTLFLGGAVSDGQGEGVWRSQDAGLSWQPVWTGLTHLRVRDLAVSPNFAEDKTVLALADYVRLDPWDSGVSAHRSIDGGLTWSRTVTFTAESAPPDAEQLLSGPDNGESLLIPVRSADYGRAIEMTVDGGETWQPATLAQPLPGALLLAVVPAPDTPPGSESVPTVYVLGDYGLWRVRVGPPSLAGAPPELPGVVERWADERLAGRGYLRKLTALAVSPVLNNGSHRLAVGTYAGELWLLDPATMTWEALGAEQLGAGTLLTATAPVAVETSLTASITHTEDSVTATVALPAPTAITPALSLTGTYPVAGDPPEGLFRPEGMYAGMWAGDPALQSLLGWATSVEPAATNMADQIFENGRMFWREDEQAIYVLYRDNTWEVFPDTFEEGQAESDPGLTAPANRLQPIRGFGKVWREQPVVRERLGWATAKEVGYPAAVHPFERGFLVRVGGLVYAVGLDADGRRVWRVV